MKYPRKVLTVHQIEPVTDCQLRCSYCPLATTTRPKEYMTWEIFLRTLEWAKHFDKENNQPELSLTGIGEATMHPRFIDMLREARKVLPKTNILFSTNGFPSFTEDTAKACAENKVDVYISLHRPEIAAKAVNLARKYGVLKAAHASFATSSVDWAGTLQWPVSAPRTPCMYLRLGWGTILVDGSISTCCYDSEKLGVVGHVNDEIGSAYVKPYSLCAKCHMFPEPETE